MSKSARVVLLVLSALLLTSCAFPSAVVVAPRPAFEYDVQVGNGIVGTLVQPDGPGRFPAVLMLHGFGSQRHEVGDMYRREAQALADLGIASLRIDFLGGGESAGNFEDTTIGGQAADAAAALAYLRSLDFVDPARVGVLGFSLGGGIAMITAGAYPDEIASMAVWSTVGNFHDDFLEELGQEMFDEAASQGSAFKDLGWRTITLKNAFFESLDDYNLNEELAKYDGPFLAIAGGDDPLSRFAWAFAEQASGPSEAWVLPEADHIYYVFGEDQSKVEQVLALTAQHFARTL